MITKLGTIDKEDLISSSGGLGGGLVPENTPEFQEETTYELGDVITYYNPTTNKTEVYMYASTDTAPQEGFDPSKWMLVDTNKEIMDLKEKIDALGKLLASTNDHVHTHDVQTPLDWTIEQMSIQGETIKMEEKLVVFDTGIVKLPEKELDLPEAPVYGEWSDVVTVIREKQLDAVTISKQKDVEYNETYRIFRVGTHNVTRLAEKLQTSPSLEEGESIVLSDGEVHTIISGGVEKELVIVNAFKRYNKTEASLSNPYGGVVYEVIDGLVDNYQTIQVGDVFNVMTDHSFTEKNIGDMVYTHTGVFEIHSKTEDGNVQMKLLDGRIIVPDNEFTYHEDIDTTNFSDRVKDSDVLSVERARLSTDNFQHILRVEFDKFMRRETKMATDTMTEQYGLMAVDQEIDPQPIPVNVDGVTYVNHAGYAPNMLSMVVPTVGRREVINDSVVFKPSKGLFDLSIVSPVENPFISFDLKITDTVDGEVSLYENESIQKNKWEHISGETTNISNIIDPDDVYLDWKSISARGGHTVALTTNGELYAWGSNGRGQLGDGRTINRHTPTRIGSRSDWNSISTGANHTVALTTKGELYAWGRNTNGRLGVGTTTDRLTPTRIGSRSDWKSISAGEQHTIALTTNGELYAWGRNNNGQLGDGRTIDRRIPTRIGSRSDWKEISSGYQHTVALATNGELYAWGSNNNGQLGDGTTTSRHTPTRIGSRSDWKEISAGYSHTVALTTSGELYTWGYNSYGKLGDGTNTNRHTPTRIGSRSDWKEISTRGSHTVALTANGELYAWGRNSSGQLGDDTTTDRHTPTRIGSRSDWKSIRVGEFHTVALTTNGELYAWGHNSNGQLGDGTTTNRHTPTRIGSRSDWKSISVGDYHTVALTANGELYAWGRNDYGQLGDGTTTSRFTPTRIGARTDWKEISAGYDYTVALTTNGELYGWGYNGAGRLGDGTTTDRHTPTHIGVFTTSVLENSVSEDVTIQIKNLLVTDKVSTVEDMDKTHPYIETQFPTVENILPTSKDQWINKAFTVTSDDMVEHTTDNTKHSIEEAMMVTHNYPYMFQNKTNQATLTVYSLGVDNRLLEKVTLKHGDVIHFKPLVKSIKVELNTPSLPSGELKISLSRDEKIVPQGKWSILTSTDTIDNIKLYNPSLSSFGNDSISTEETFVFKPTTHPSYVTSQTQDKKMINVGDAFVITSPYDGYIDSIQVTVDGVPVKGSASLEDDKVTFIFEESLTAGCDVTFTVISNIDNGLEHIPKYIDRVTVNNIPCKLSNDVRIDLAKDVSYQPVENGLKIQLSDYIPNYGYVNPAMRENVRVELALNATNVEMDLNGEPIEKLNEVYTINRSPEDGDVVTIVTDDTIEDLRIELVYENTQGMFVPTIDGYVGEEDLHLYVDGINILHPFDASVWEFGDKASFDPEHPYVIDSKGSETKTSVRVRKHTVHSIGCSRGSFTINLYNGKQLTQTLVVDKPIKLSTMDNDMIEVLITDVVEEPYIRVGKETGFIPKYHGETDTLLRNSELSLRIGEDFLTSDQIAIISKQDHLSIKVPETGRITGSIDLSKISGKELHGEVVGDKGVNLSVGGYSLNRNKSIVLNKSVETKEIYEWKNTVIVKDAKGVYHTIDNKGLYREIDGSDDYHWCGVSETAILFYDTHRKIIDQYNHENRSMTTLVESVDVKKNNIHAVGKFVVYVDSDDTINIVDVSTGDVHKTSTVLSEDQTLFVDGQMTMIIAGDENSIHTITKDGLTPHKTTIEGTVVAVTKSNVYYVDNSENLWRWNTVSEEKEKQDTSMAVVITSNTTDRVATDKGIVSISETYDVLDTGIVMNGEEIVEFPEDTIRFVVTAGNKEVNYLQLRVRDKKTYGMIKKNIIIPVKNTNAFNTLFRPTITGQSIDIITISYTYDKIENIVENKKLVILAEEDSLFGTDIGVSTPTRFVKSHYSYPAERVGHMDGKLYGDIEFVDIPLSVDGRQINLRSEVTVGPNGFVSGYTRQYSEKAIKKPIVAIARYLVLDENEVKLLIIAQYIENGQYFTGDGENTNTYLIPLENNPIIDNLRQVTKRNTITENVTKGTNSLVVEGYTTEDGHVIATYN